MSEKLNLELARECAVLAQSANRTAVLNQISNSPTFSVSLAYCIQRLTTYIQNGGNIDAKKLMELSPDAFNIPTSFPCGMRYSVTLRGSQLLSDVDLLRNRLSAHLGSIRPLYRNYVVRFVLRAGYALDHPEIFTDVLKQPESPEGSTVQTSNERKTLVVGDIHLKEELILGRVDAAISQLGIERIVFCGDYVDEWNSNDLTMSDAIDALSYWIRSKRKRGIQVGLVLGNHDM